MVWDTQHSTTPSDPPRRSARWVVFDAAVVVGLIGALLTAFGIWVAHHDAETAGRGAVGSRVVPGPSGPSPDGGAAGTDASIDPACADTAIHGSLDVGEGTVAGGPNTVHRPCTSVLIRLTEAPHRTYARSCLEDPTGEVTTGCSGWKRLSADWTVLSDEVAPESRWRLEMYGDDDGHVEFFFTG